MSRRENNYAFIDGQNVNLGVQQLGWKMDWKKFRIYLRHKYDVERAYYFIGYVEENRKLYRFLEYIGYTLVFKPIVRDHYGGIKGNVDADVVLNVLLKVNQYDKALLVTGDGDFYSLAEHLYSTDKLLLVVAPCRAFCSSLLQKYARERMSYLDRSRRILEYTYK